MHIPNGFLSDPVCALTIVVSGTALGLGAWQARRSHGHPDGQTLAAVGALVFAAQMVNFPVDHGTSGHLIGGALATALLGPWGAMWAMASVVTTQAVLFGDGGIATLGANLLTMAVAAPWTAWLAYRCLAACGLTSGRSAENESAASSKSAGREALGWGLASMVSVLAAATVCSLLLAWGGTAPAAGVLPAMLWAHLPVGIAEGVATTAVVLLAAGRIRLPLASRSPQRATGITSPGWELLPADAGSASAPRVLLAAAAMVAVVLAPLASSAPDGLETVAARLGLLPSETGGFAGLLPDYVLPGIAWAPLAVALAGLIGVTAVSAAGYVVCRTTAGVRKSR